MVLQVYIKLMRPCLIFFVVFLHFLCQENGGPLGLFF